MVIKTFDLSSIDIITHDWMFGSDRLVSNRKYDGEGCLIFENRYTVENYFRTAMGKIQHSDIIVVDWSSTSDLIKAQAEYAKEIGKFVMYVEPEIEY